MSEAYFRVESGALGPEENFLSLDDILMSHEKLSVRTEIPMPRLGAFFLDRSGGAETDNAIPEVPCRRPAPLVLNTPFLGREPGAPCTVRASYLIPRQVLSMTLDCSAFLTVPW